MTDTAFTTADLIKGVATGEFPEKIFFEAIEIARSLKWPSEDISELERLSRLSKKQLQDYKEAADIRDSINVRFKKYWPAIYEKAKRDKELQENMKMTDLTEESLERAFSEIQKFNDTMKIPKTPDKRILQPL